MEGPGPMRGSLDEVIPCTADDISSELEQNHYQHNVLGTQVLREALEKVNGFTRSCSAPDFAVLSLAGGRGFIRKNKNGLRA